MKKWKIVIAILLAIILIAGVTVAVNNCGGRGKEQIEQETPPPQNTAVIDALNRIIALLENGVDNQASVNESILSRFGELSERINGDRDDIDGIVSELENVFIALYSIEAEIGAMETYDDMQIFGLYNSVLGSLANLIKDNNVLAISHADLLKLYQSLQAFVNRLENDMQNMDFDLGLVKADLQTIKQAVIALQSDYAELSVSLYNAYTLINSLTADFDIFRTDLTALNNTVSDIQNSLGTLGGDCGCSGLLSDLQRDITETQNRLNQHDSALQALQNAVDSLMWDMSGRVGNIENILSALEYTVSFWSSELYNLQSQIGNYYYSDIYNLTMRIDALENALYWINMYDYSALENRMYNLEWEMWNWQNRLTELENRVAELQKPVELLFSPLVIAPFNWQSNAVNIPYEIAYQLSDKDSFKITVGAFLENDVLIIRTIELRLFFFWNYPVISTIDGVSILGIEWLMAVALHNEYGNYYLSFETLASFSFWEIAEMKVLSVEYVKGN